MSHLRTFFVSISILMLCFLAGADRAFAATGTIVAGSQYSQFLNIDLDNNGTKDFINWIPTCGGTGGANNCPNPVQVTNSTITGDIWGESVGWIRLNPDQSGAGPTAGVKNTCSGVLSGYAWGENTGWINFAPTYATGADQPKINTATGAITGTVWSQNYGWITLNSSDGTYSGLTTTWHGCGGSTPTGGGGTVTGNNGCPLPTVWNGFACVQPVNSPGNGCLPPLVWNGSACVGITVPPTGTVPPGGVTPPTDTTPPAPPGTAGNPPHTGAAQPPTSGSSAPRSSAPLTTPNGGKLPLLGVTLLSLIGLLATFPGFITRFSNLLLTLFFGLKRQRGVVYDSKTKEPLDPAYISVVNLMTGKEVATQITDMQGRYGLVLRKGTYKLVVNKTHYQFPSILLAGKTHDEVYDNLYHGEAFTIEDEKRVITMNVPMDSLETDWNQQEKRRMNFIAYLIKNQGGITWIVDAVLIVGFFSSLVITCYYPIWWNILIMGLYVIAAALELLGFGPITAGTITRDGRPLSHAIVRVYNARLNREIAHGVTTELGSYYLLVPRADYYVTVDQKNPDGTYTHVFTSGTIRVASGVIHQSFTI